VNGIQFSMNTLTTFNLPNRPIQTCYRILIADDNAAHRKLCREILDHDLYNVTEVSQGQDVLDQLRAQEFDLIILDKNLPDIFGNDVCRIIRDDLQQHFIPIIVVTGDGSSQSLRTSLRCGATDFIRKPFEPTEMLARVERALDNKKLTDQLDSAESMLYTMARMVEAKDENTGDHCSRLVHVCNIFAHKLGLSPEEILALQRGSVLHDIGKIGIPDRILLKNGPLTDDEWVIMQQHTTIGARLLADLKTMKDVVPIVKHHHEKWNGTGYPDRLQREEIPFLARIFQLVDIFDALAHARPYKKAFSKDEILSIFKKETEQGWRDPTLCAVFIDLIHESFELMCEPEDSSKTPGKDLFSEIRASRR
jgi:putative two-component system response regulator